MQITALWFRLLAGLLVLFLLAACGERADDIQDSVIRMPLRLPLTAEPVKVELNRGGYNRAGFTVTLISGSNEIIGQNRFLLNASSGATLGGVAFNYTSANAGGGTLTFNMDQRQYDAVKSASGAALGRIRIAFDDTQGQDITGFGDGWLQFKEAYTYAFANDETGARFEYLADPDRLAGVSKSWNISMEGEGPSHAVKFLEDCSHYTWFSYTEFCSKLFTSTAAPFDAKVFYAFRVGTYDVNVKTADLVTRNSTGDFTTKLIVGRYPVARLRLTNSAVSTVGSTLFYDATASQADRGSTVAYTLDKPALSKAVLANEDTRTPSLVTDVAGTYTLTLSVSFNGVTDTVSVERVVFPPVTGGSGN